MDYMITAIDSSKQVCVCAIKTTEMVEQMRKYHDTYPVVSAAIGRTMTAASMMGLSMKDIGSKLSIIIKGDGPIGTITVTSDSRGYVKATANKYDIDMPARESDGKLDVRRAVGQNGVITVVKDLGMKEPYVGKAPIVSGEIAKDIAYYLSTSEQINSSVGLGVLVDVDYTIKHAGGFLVSLLPFAKEETIQKLEQNLSKIKSVTKMMQEGKTPEDIAAIILDGMGMEILAKDEVKYECDCNVDRIKKILVTIGKDELQKIYDEDEQLEMQCHFCDKKYNFNKEELKEIIDQL